MRNRGSIRTAPPHVLLPLLTAPESPHLVLGSSCEWSPV